ncbi:MAG: 2-phospho-L-lactate guanylyltransferase [Acidimicrobiales bacterium]
MVQPVRPSLSAVVLLPIKSFGEAKHRLSPVLDARERSDLARELASRVVRAARELPVAIVCDDHDVAAWAKVVGASVLWRPGVGLNGAVAAGVEALREDFDEVIVAHADLPHARDLTVVRGFAGITLVPDRHRDGTNVMCMPSDCGFRFAYGPGSFARHQDEVALLGLTVRVLTDAALAWDIDTPDDLLGFDGKGFDGQGLEQ